VSGPSPRYISNRIFNDEGQNLFSENGETQWGWAWGQFLDHTFGLEWLRTGPVDGNMANNGATLMLDSKGYLPRADARGNASTAPHMDLMGALVGAPSTAVEAGASSEPRSSTSPTTSSSRRSA
jgi:hypothetical protein